MSTEMVIAIAGTIACLGYGSSTYFLVNGLRHHALNRKLILSLGCGALMAHGLMVFNGLFKPDGVQLGVITLASFFMWVVVALGTASCLFRRIEPLLAPSYPLALLTVVIELVYADTTAPTSGLSKGMLFHIGSSLIAYSAMTLAFSQAVLIWIQNYQLKHRHIHDILRLLPPLQTMEDTLFDLVFTGFALLSVAILTGFVYVDDLFAQHLLHKTALTILSWLVLAILILGRFAWGWRGMIAVRWTLTGFVLLLLGFFGSKVVLELILQRG
ncbi:MAG: cytochrome c biogenesis protein CcsA [Ketobacteraceae bacterium]|nr:cytochrome c biogenesis protein CcsA [Ketobacteraceae bacterium]